MTLRTLLPSTIIPSIIPRVQMDMDFFDMPLDISSGLSSLDLFDPFDVVDRMLNQNSISFLTQPQSLLPEVSLVPLVPEKYRISVYCPGFSDENIKTEVSKDNKKLVVTAKEGEQLQQGDFQHREMKRTYDLPHNVDANNLMSFRVGNNRLVVEFPLKQTESKLAALEPVIEDAADGNKKVVLNVSIPDNIDPSKVTVTCKDRDVVVKANYREQKDNTESSVYYMRRSTMPINTDFNSLKCSTQNGNQLRIEANLGHNPNRSIPIQIENLSRQQQSQIEQQNKSTKQQQQGEQKQQQSGQLPKSEQQQQSAEQKKSEQKQQKGEQQQQQSEQQQQQQSAEQNKSEQKQQQSEQKQQQQGEQKQQQQSAEQNKSAQQQSAQQQKKAQHKQKG